MMADEQGETFENFPYMEMRKSVVRLQEPVDMKLSEHSLHLIMNKPEEIQDMLAAVGIPAITAGNVIRCASSGPAVIMSQKSQLGPVSDIATRMAITPRPITSEIGVQTDEMMITPRRLRSNLFCCLGRRA